MKNKILEELDRFKGQLEEYLQGQPEETQQAEYVVIEEPEAVSEDTRCEVCQKAINELEGAYRVGDQYWVCSTSCEDKIEIRPTIKFKYR